MEGARRALQSEMEAYRAVQKDIQSNLRAQQQLVAQSNENEAVMEELTRLGDDAGVYKLIGPALIKQDLVEAKANVSKRLEYIKRESERLGKLVASHEAKAAEHQKEVLKLQKRIQGAVQPTSG